MRIYKPTYRDRDGQVCKCAKFYTEVRTADGRVLRLPGFENQRLTESLGRNVQRLIDCRASGEILPQDTAKWVETLPHQTARVLTRWGLLQGHTLAAGTPLSQHITDWRADLLARGNTEKHANLSAARVKRLTESCGFKLYGDISAAKVQQELADRRKDSADADGNPVRGMGIKTTNYYLRDLKSFCRWMMHERRATTSAVEYLDAMNARADIRVQRRALSITDMRKLLDTARMGPERHGIDGPQRALIYELAATTGLRVSELASLTAGSFCLGESPSVTIAAAYAKNRRQDSLPLRADMAGLLRAFLAAKVPGTKAFPKLNNRDSADMLKADLQAAGLPYYLDGKTFDFHALRHQFISDLAAAGVHPKTAQQLARHSTITLTMDNYTHVFRGDLDKAIDALPNWRTAESQSLQAAGTTDTPIGENVLAHSWALSGIESKNSVEPDGVLAMQGKREQNPLSMQQSSVLQSDSDKGRSGIRTHESRICNPLP